MEPLTVTQLILLFDAYRGIKPSRHLFNDNRNQDIGVLLSRKLIKANGFTETFGEFDFAPTDSGTEFVRLCQTVSIELIYRATKHEHHRGITCNMAIALLDCALIPQLHVELHLATLASDLRNLTTANLIEKCKGGYRPTKFGSLLIEYWKAISIVP